MMSRRNGPPSLVLLTALSLACVCSPGPPERLTCDDGAPSAELDRIDVFGGWSRGIQGSDMISANVTFYGSDVPDCATVSVVAESRRTGATIWRETASMETFEASPGVYETRGLLFREGSPNSDECAVRLTASAYGQTAVHESFADDFSGCEAAPPTRRDAGPTEDAGTTDAGTTDAGTTDAGTTDAGTTDAGTTDAGL